VTYAYHCGRESLFSSSRDTAACVPLAKSAARFARLCGPPWASGAAPLRGSCTALGGGGGGADCGCMNLIALKAPYCGHEGARGLSKWIGVTLLHRTRGADLFLM